MVIFSNKLVLMCVYKASECTIEESAKIGKSNIGKNSVVNTYCNDELEDLLQDFKMYFIL